MNDRETPTAPAVEELYTYLFRNGPLPMWVVDRESLEFLDVNLAAERQYGYTREEFLRMRVIDLRTEPSATLTASDYAYLAKSPENRLGRRHRRKDGSVIDVLLSAHGMVYRDRPANLVQVVDLSEILEARREREASEKRFGSLVEQAPMAIQRFSPDGEIRSANPAWEHLWGVSRDHLAGYNILQDPQLERNGMAEPVRAAFNGQARTIPAVRYDPAETGRVGRVRWIEASVYPVLGTRGELQEVVLLLRDATDRIEADRILKSREETFSRFLDSSLDAVVMMDEDGRVTEWRGAAPAMFGYTPEEAVGRPVAELIIPERFRSFHSEGVARLRQGGEPRVLSQRLSLIALRRDGEEFPIELEVAAIPRDGKSIYGAFVRDLTEAKRAEAEIQALNAGLEERVRQRTQELAEERAFLGAVLEGATDGIVACDAKGTLRLFNRAAREFHGQPVQALAPDEWAQTFDLFAADGTTHLKTEDVPLLRALREGHVEDVEMIIAAHGQPPRPVSCTGSALYDGAGKKLGAVVVMHDITQRKRLVERNEQLAEAVSELQGFTYTVSHDLRAPLRGIVGNSRILLEDYGQSIPEGAKDHLDRVSLASLKMASLIEDLLAYARLGHGEPHLRTTPLAPLVRQVAEAGEFEGCDIRIDVPEEEAVQADPMLLRLAVQNLLENACKYRARGTRAQVTVACEHSGEDLVVSVKDEGIGFDMAYANKLFLPFERLHRDGEYPGTGIGLANVRRIVERHGGRIWAESDGPGTGAQFYFTLSRD